ncbi:MAG: peroxide stress protein YaaA [Nakamurella sp.]
MLVVLPPSETKATGGDGPALRLADLLWPELRHTREILLDYVGKLAADLPASRAALKVTAAKDAEIRHNAVLRSAPTMPALNRYTGVLFDALDAAGMSRGERGRAHGRIIVISALFGAVRASDPIPEYRLSAGSRLPGLGTIAALWKPVLTGALAALDGPILDLRSGAYAAFGVLPGAISARVVTEQPDGTRIVVSHFNKATKGRLARAVATAPREVTTIAGVISLASRVGLNAQRIGPTEIEIVT